jgi:hypothetical protein
MGMKNSKSKKDDIAIMYKFKNIIYETFTANKNNIIDYLNENKIKYAKFIDKNENDKNENDKNENDKNDKNEENEKQEIIIQKKKKFFIQMYNLEFYLEYTKLYDLVLEINIQ